MNSKAMAAAHIRGSVRAVDGKGVVRVEDRFDTDINDLWLALTEPDRLARWIGEVEGELRLGGEFNAHFFATGWQGTGRVEACEPPHRLVIVTRDPNLPDEDVIEATLTADGDGTTLLFEQRGVPLDQIAGYGAGLQVHVEDLAAYIAGHGRGDAKARWDELLPTYQAMVANVS